MDVYRYVLMRTDVKICVLIYTKLYSLGTHIVKYRFGCAQLSLNIGCAVREYRYLSWCLDGGLNIVSVVLFARKYRIVSLARLASLIGEYRYRRWVALSCEIVIACGAGMLPISDTQKSVPCHRLIMR